MNLFDDLNEKNYLHFAMKYYDNRQCTSVEEFNEDLNKIKYVKRLFNRFLGEFPNHNSSTNRDVQTVFCTELRNLKDVI